MFDGFLASSSAHFILSNSRYISVWLSMCYFTNIHYYALHTFVLSHCLSISLCECVFLGTQTNNIAVINVTHVVIDFMCERNEFECFFFFHFWKSKKEGKNGTNKKKRAFFNRQYKKDIWWYYWCAIKMWCFLLPFHSISFNRGESLYFHRTTPSTETHAHPNNEAEETLKQNGIKLRRHPCRTNESYIQCNKARTKDGWRHINISLLL